MSDHDKRSQGNVPKKAQGQRVGTAALVAAASLLGTSLGVAAGGSGEPVGPGANSAGQNAVEICSGEPENMRLAAVKVPVVTPPHISIKTNQIKTTNQVKTTNQIKTGDPLATNKKGGWDNSDIRLKRDITAVARLDNGINLYSFRYRWSDQVYVGVMAQEVAAIVPDAVVMASNGYLAVCYDRLGLRMQTLEQWRAGH
jgi:Chaperone of endosialidase